MFIGEYHYNIDNKGRLAIPAPMRAGLGQSAVVTRGLDGCVGMYPKKSWESWAQKLLDLPVSQAQARSFVRFQLASAHEVSLDKQGRILIPAPIRQYAQAKTKVVVTGVGDRIEIWSQDKWERLSDKVAQNASAIAEGIGIWDNFQLSISNFQTKENINN